MFCGVHPGLRKPNKTLDTQKHPYRGSKNSVSRPACHGGIRLVVCYFNLIFNFLQKLQDVDTSGVLGVGVARVRTSGSRMQAWITYGGPDGTGALNLGGGTLFSYFYAVVRTRGNNRVKVAAFLTPMYSRNMHQLFE
eukprot:scaffold4499_cov122-Isochrysis_galbana.AAC.6